MQISQFKAQVIKQITIGKSPAFPSQITCRVTCNAFGSLAYNAKFALLPFSTKYIYNTTDILF